MNDKQRGKTLYEKDDKQFRVHRYGARNTLVIRYQDLTTPNESISIRRFNSLILTGKIKAVEK